MKTILLVLVATFSLTAYDKLDLNSMSRPRLIEKQEPKYTVEAREAKIEGTVRLNVFIDTDGMVTEAEVDKPLGFGLDLAALEAVATWRFEPARKLKDGTPVRVPATIEVNFRLL